MSIYGNQFYHCPNCGSQMYGPFQLRAVMALTCCDECRHELDRKYAASILGHDAIHRHQHKLERLKNEESNSDRPQRTED